MKRFLNPLILIVFLVSACNLPSSVTDIVPVPTSTPLPPTITPVPEPLDLTHRPLYWFAPLPPQPGGPYNGSDDYMSLFAPGSDWRQAANFLQVFKLYGGWVARDSSNDQLRGAMEAIRQRGLALAVEVGPLNPTNECGLYIEGFAGEEGVRTVQRIKAMGGDLNFIAFDEPYYYGHFYDGDQACNWSAEKIAQDVDSFIQQVHLVFPNVIIGDIEPVTGPADARAYNDWLDTFRAVNRYDLAFLHLDIDWSDTRWPEKVKTVEEHGKAIGIPIGIIYNGNYQDETDEAWFGITGERIKRYEQEYAGDLDHIVFQSWHDKPDRALPESDPLTYTGFIRMYFENYSALGFQLESIANVALKKSVRISNLIDGYPGTSAVDGDLGTSWSSGSEAPQWIEIDLGETYDVRTIRLLPSQYPAGATVHRVQGRGPGTGGNFVDLHIFDGNTEDSKWLEFTPPSPWLGIQVIRIETISSPSWIAWREIEILR